MISDNDLYKQFLSGNILSFEELVLRHKDNLIYFLQRYVNDLYIAEDIAQDAFVYIYVYKDKFNFKFNIKTFIYTIAKNKAIDYIRKNSKTVSIEGYEDLELQENELEKKIIQNEEKRIVNEAIKRLKKDYQAALFLIDFQEFSYSEAAKILGKSLPQFRILIFRARKSLKSLLEKEGYMYEE